MNIKKISILSTLLTVLFFTNVHGTAQEYGRIASAGTSDLKKKIKFGIRLNSILSGHKIGLFAEYKINEVVGLQTGLLHFNDSYIMVGLEGSIITHATVETTKCVSVPLIARFYPGEERQFCIFAGFQINYLRDVRMHLFYCFDEDDVRKEVKEFFERSWQGKETYNKKDMNARGITINNWGSHFLMGFDYEYTGGFQLGLEYGLGLSSIAKCNTIAANWTLKPSLGYNFAKLLK